ncbi:MAG: hypothetical protein ACRDFB_09520, partial [Rhabdochlamydiaceae bacterium]
LTTGFAPSGLVLASLEPHFSRHSASLRTPSTSLIVVWQGFVLRTKKLLSVCSKEVLQEKGFHFFGRITLTQILHHEDK